MRRRQNKSDRLGYSPFRTADRGGFRSCDQEPETDLSGGTGSAFAPLVALLLFFHHQLAPGVGVPDFGPLKDCFCGLLALRNRAWLGSCSASIPVTRPIHWQPENGAVLMSNTSAEVARYRKISSTPCQSCDEINVSDVHDKNSLPCARRHSVFDGFIELHRSAVAGTGEYVGDGFCEATAAAGIDSTRRYPGAVIQYLSPAGSW